MSTRRHGSRSVKSWHELTQGILIGKALPTCGTALVIIILLQSTASYIDVSLDALLSLVFGSLHSVPARLLRKSLLHLAGGHPILLRLRSFHSRTRLFQWLFGCYDWSTVTFTAILGYMKSFCSLLNNLFMKLIFF